MQRLGLIPLKLRPRGCSRLTSRRQKRFILRLFFPSRNLDFFVDLGCEYPETLSNVNWPKNNGKIKIWNGVCRPNKAIDFDLCKIIRWDRDVDGIDCPMKAMWDQGSSFSIGETCIWRSIPITNCMANPLPIHLPSRARIGCNGSTRNWTKKEVMEAEKSGRKSTFLPKLEIQRSKA